MCSARHQCRADEKLSGNTNKGQVMFWTKHWHAPSLGECCLTTLAFSNNFQYPIHRAIIALGANHGLVKGKALVRQFSYQHYSLMTFGLMSHQAITGVISAPQHTQGPTLNPALTSGGHRNRQVDGGTQPWRHIEPTHTTPATLLDLTSTLTPRPATPTTTTTH